MLNSIETVREGIDEWLEHDIDYSLKADLTTTGIRFIVEFELDGQDCAVEQYVSNINLHLAKDTKVLLRGTGRNIAMHINSFMEAQNKKGEKDG